MKIKLHRIKKEKYDDLLQLVVNNFNQSGNFVFDAEIVQSYSEPIIIEGQNVEVDIDVDEYIEIASESGFGYTKFAKIGMRLHKDFNSEKLNIPRNIFYEKEFWAYISILYFYDIVKILRMQSEEKITENKIKQFYFNAGEISRTGLLFLWCMVDRLGSENDFEITHTAFEFVDPVKAILERTMSKNPDILRAFVQGIINNGKNALFKSDKYRSKVPSHISCYASISVLDALEYEELVEVITEQQKAIIA